jgi:hypothetical protein
MRELVVSAQLANPEFPQRHRAAERETTDEHRYTRMKKKNSKGDRQEL